MRELIRGGIVSAADQMGKLTSQASPYVKIWYATIAFRVMIIYSVGQEIYSKEETSFECATKQFLCRTVCYDQFMPINLIRFWIWQTHFLALVVLLMNWLRTSLHNQETNIVKTSKSTTKIFGEVACFLQSFLLLTIEVAFGAMLFYLLSRQHSLDVTFRQLLSSGDLFFSPSIYVCDIQKTFSEEEKTLYFNKENIEFRKTPAGLRVKSQLACEQSDALCTIDRSSEKTIIVLSMTLFNCLGVISLFTDLLNHTFKISRPLVKNLNSE